MEKFNSDVIADNINTIYNNLSIQGEGQINLNPPYQREVVWDQNKKMFFIDSIIKNIVPTNLIFNIDTEKNQRICIDGKQRCTSIKEFMDNKWPIQINDDYYFYGPEDKIKKSVYENYSNYKIFTSTERSDFMYKKIPIVTYRNLKYEDQLEVFGRIQQGSPLTDGEKISCHFYNLKSFSEITDFFDLYKDKDILKKYTSFERKKHHKFIFDIMYHIQEGLKNLSKNNADKFVQKLDNDIKLLKKVISKTQSSINLIFVDELLNHPSICKLKIKKSVLNVIIYFLNKKYDKNLFEKNYGNIRKAIIKTTNFIDENKYKINSNQSTLEEFQKILNDHFDKYVVEKESEDYESDNSATQDSDDSEDEDKQNSKIVKKKKLKINKQTKSN